MSAPRDPAVIWRSLAEAAEGEAFRTRLIDEFPGLGDLLAQPHERRGLLKLMAASIALGGLSGCGKPGHDGLIPPVIQPPGVVPGVAASYSSASLIGGYASGTLVTHREGRPIKVEGNPDHPASLGATDVFAQAQIWSFYDPDRAQGVAFRGQLAGDDRLLAAIAALRGRMGQTRGKGFRLLTGGISSPTLQAQIAQLRQAYPAMQWHQWDAVPREQVRRGAVMAYGRNVEIVPDLSQVDCLLALDSDLLSAAPGHLRHARDFAAKRNPARAAMSRVYAAESTPSLTGAAADHRYSVMAPQWPEIYAGLAAGIIRGESLPEGTPDWLAGVIADLKSRNGRALIHCGPDQPAEAQALVHAANEALGGRGKSFALIPPVLAAGADGLAPLVAAMRTGAVEALLMFGCNPAFDAPADLDFAAALGRVNCSINLAPAFNETSAAATWHMPETHDFEAWSDARAFDGTACIIQPQALPLYGGRSAHETLALFLGDPAPDGAAILRRQWRMLDDAAWARALRDGVVAGSGFGRLGEPLRPDAVRTMPPAPVGLTLLLKPDPQLWDGRFANNGWLQEMPRPLTKLAWDNPLLIAAGLAARLKLANGDHVALQAGGRRVAVPVWIMPGQAEDCVTGLFGFGRRVAGQIGSGAGFDFFPLRSADHLGSVAVSIAKLAGHTKLATTEHHNLLIGGEESIIRHASLAQFQARPDLLRGENPGESIYDPPPLSDVAWGMSIDLNACIGCNACVIACQAENNVPVVGKEQVLREREMHWLRIDRYYGGSVETPDILFQPMLCMHCEHAPCEPVCPVGATVHDSEGLNVMVYNRCIGTRFCSNNCPYKVRRFNYLGFSAEEHRPDESRNPEVTVRARGVMEKCTLCVQRIAAARIDADKEDRAIEDGAVVTACQAACPTRAISFGNQNDKHSEVAARKASPLSYPLLADLNTRPRVTYEGRIRNQREDEA